MAEVRLTEVGLKRCRAVVSRSKKQPPPPYDLHLAVAPTKSNDRYEWFVEKAVEIGISEITPVICAHSERKIIKLDRIERVAIAAMKQSLKSWLPRINQAVPLAAFLRNQNGGGLKAIAHCAEGPKERLSKLLVPGRASTILIGPEGDFSPVEIKEALAAGYQAVNLGEQRLRTETAALVACHSVAFINNN
jgi:16S rRNA (uracil1498-N3)-methyltransferase